MDTKSLDELRSKLASRVQLYDHLHHVCTHGGYFANIAYVAPGELFEMLTAAALPFDSAALLALASSLEQFFALPPILSVHGSRRLALELQWWLKQRSAPEYDAAIVENRLSTSGVDGQAAVLLPMRPLYIKQVFVLPSLPAQPSPAATCRVMDAAARNAGLRIGHPALEVLDLLGVQWAHHADVVNGLAHAFHVLMQFAQQMDAGLQIAWGSHAPSEGAQKDDPATAAHRQRMAAACASVQAFDTYIQSALVQPVLDLLRGVASTKLSCLVGPLLHTQLRQGGGGIKMTLTHQSRSPQIQKLLHTRKLHQSPVRLLKVTPS